MDCKRETDRICKFIKDTVKEAGADGVVLGISGGLDSAVVYKLCVKALGENSITTIFIPDRDNIPTPMHIRDLMGINKVFKIQNLPNLESIERPTDYIVEDCENTLIIGNVKARLRMTYLYFYANIHNKLVIGTTNKSEYLIGYFTKYGDGGVDFEPIQHLYKTEVYELAKYLKVPKEIIEAKPTAGLWEGQTDEDEIGMSYEKLDRILKHLSNNTPYRPSFKEQGINTKDFDRVVRLIKSSEHKRRLPKCLV